MNHIVLKSALLPKSKISLSGRSVHAEINEIIASITALSPAGIEVVREISTEKYTDYNPTTNVWTKTDLISRVSERILIKANLSSTSHYAAWTAARVDAFAKGGLESDSSLSGSIANADHSYAAFGASKVYLTIVVNYGPTRASTSGEGYQHRVHAEMAPLAALAEARALWSDVQITISNTKARRESWGRHFMPITCATVVKNFLTDLDYQIDLVKCRAEWAAKRAAELTPDLIAEEAARVERNRIRAERREAALAKANAGDEKYWPAMAFGGTELKIKSSLLNTSDIEAIAEIIAAAKARKAAKEAAKKAA